MFRIPPFSVAALALFAAAAFARAAPLVLDTPAPPRSSPGLAAFHPTSSCAPAPLRRDTPDSSTNIALNLACTIALNLSHIRTWNLLRACVKTRPAHIRENATPNATCARTRTSTRTLTRTPSVTCIRTRPPICQFFNSLNTSAPAGGTIGVGIQNTSIAWTVAEPAGQDLFLLLTDSGTSTAESSRVVVGPSNDASCLA
ncbi:hypothetical protein K488DRAFT_85356 [Vararia minispora EC-137]|uniref:Uncharacterized protein n=1 Tax=Vararia minispora EC-137 TaxID=1314806 RepID=A0ACB8QMU6_9AGAM|nr:hypothetical protein K488DRAFT_85356 [Vararia minispora EC-137]